MKRRLILFLAWLPASLLVVGAYGQSVLADSTPTEQTKQSACVGCHQKVTPGLVKDHLSGKMGQKNVDCSTCHGSEHRDEKTVAKAKLPTEQTCKKCHEKQMGQFMAGKHALGWVAMTALPLTKMQPHAAIAGLKGCGGCHKVGIRDEAARAESRYGIACDSCHTRHKFSKDEARRPESCLPCHKGPGYIQWESWSQSKHGTVYRTNGDNGRAPKCQTCHMQEGNHSVMTSWGGLAVRAEETDKAWLKDRAAIFKYVGALDVDGKPTPGFEGLLGLKVFRGPQAEWQAEREKMIRTCARCHSKTYAEKSLKSGDEIVRETDKILAEAIETVADLYSRGIMQPAPGQPSYPNLGMMYELKLPIEQTLWRMLIERRGAAFHGAFHSGPHYVTWYGLSDLKKDLAEVKHHAQEMIRQAGKH